MTILAPDDIEFRHAAGWAYLTVARKAGHSTQVQYNDGQGWHSASQQVSEYLVPMYQHGDPTEWRVRYGRAGAYSDWTTGRVWYPDGFAQDNSIPDTGLPPPPSGLTVVHLDTETGTATVEWDSARDHADLFWRVQLDHVDPAPRTVRTAGTTFRRLDTGVTYQWSVKSVRVDSDGFERESEPVSGPRFELKPDHPTPPPNPPADLPYPPRQLRVHCIQATSAMVEWDSAPVSDDVTSYLVTVNGSVQREVIGTLIHLSDLTPDTPYTVEVRACRDTGCSRPSDVAFRTGVDQPAPEPDPKPGAPAAPTNTFVEPLSPGRVRFSWTQPSSDPPADWWTVTTDGGSRWVRATERSIVLDVAPGVQSQIGVAAVSNGRSGMPTRLSAITMTGVKTAEKGA